jgi:hypothetical protein
MNITEINQLNARLQELYDEANVVIKNQIKNTSELDGVTRISLQCAAVSSRALATSPSWSTSYFLKDVQVNVVTECINRCGSNLIEIKSALVKLLEKESATYRGEMIRLNPCILETIKNILSEIVDLEEYCPQTNCLGCENGKYPDCKHNWIKQISR